jgi:hypothetical protein
MIKMVDRKFPLQYRIHHLLYIMTVTAIIAPFLPSAYDRYVRWYQPRLAISPSTTVGRSLEDFKKAMEESERRFEQAGIDLPEGVILPEEVIIVAPWRLPKASDETYRTTERAQHLEVEFRRRIEMIEKSEWVSD